MPQACLLLQRELMLRQEPALLLLLLLLLGVLQTEPSLNDARLDTLPFERMMLSRGESTPVSQVVGVASPKP
jgi:hypothetical protein